VAGKCVAASLALCVVISFGGCSTAPVQRPGYGSTATSQPNKISTLRGYTNPAKKETCGSFDQVSFGADGETAVAGSGRVRVCRGADGKLHES
jgi:hypothetical protein